MRPTVDFVVETVIKALQARPDLMATYTDASKDRVDFVFVEEAVGAHFDAIMDEDDYDSAVTKVRAWVTKQALEATTTADEPAASARKYRCWIYGQPKDYALLREIGIEVGPALTDDVGMVEWDPCILTEAALSKLDKHWGGRFTWGIHSTRLSPEDMAEVEANFESFWKGLLIKPDGAIDMDLVKRELFDYHQIIRRVSTVYMAVTGGKVSKPLTDPDEVIALAEEHYARGISLEIDEDPTDAS